VNNHESKQNVKLPKIGSLKKYNELMDIIRNRITVRKFDPSYEVPLEHFNLILEAARHAPSGANSQPWHFIIVQEKQIKSLISEYFVNEQKFRARAKMKFPTPDYRGLKDAPGFIIVCSDMRWTNAFPVFKNDKTDLNRMYRQNAERILLQSVASATMSAHLAASALGYNVWWVTAIGQENAQKEIKPLLGIPKEISVLDIMLFGPSAQKPYKRWRKPLNEIVNYNKFDKKNMMSDKELDEWIKTKRHKVMFKDASRID